VQCAADLIAAKRITHREAAEVQAGVDAEAVEALKRQIDSGGTPDAAGAPEAVSRRGIAAPSLSLSQTAVAPTAEAILAAGREVEIAEAAHREFEAAVTEGKRAETRAIRAVGEAAIACVIARGLAMSVEIAEAEAVLLEKRRALWGIDKLWINGGPVKLPERIVAGLAGHIMHGGDRQSELSPRERERERGVSTLTLLFRPHWGQAGA
jgi:hypothetical protein